MKTYELTIGDGHNRKKDCHMILKTSWECKDMGAWLRSLVASCLPSIADSVDFAWSDDTDDESALLIIENGPWDETDPYGGPWLIAELRRVEAETQHSSAIDGDQLDFARLWSRAA